MRTGNLTDMNGFSLQRIKVITEIPTVTSSNNGQIYLYVGDEDINDVWVGDILVVQEGKLVTLNRNALHDISGTGSVQVNIG